MVELFALFGSSQTGIVGLRPERASFCRYLPEAIASATVDEPVAC
jgi:hypothetical protein